MNRILAAAAVATLASAGNAGAMTYSYDLVGDDAVIIHAKGDIAFDELKTFSAWLQMVPPTVGHRPDFTVVLDSPGGNPFGAFNLGEAIRKGGGDTSVEANGMCASACVLTWAAGVKKSAAATSRIGVHNASVDQSKLTDEEKKNASNENAPLYAKTWSFEMSQQLSLYGAPDRVVVKAMMTSATNIYWLTADDVKAWGASIRTDAPHAAPTPPPPPATRMTQADPPGLY